MPDKALLSTQDLSQFLGISPSTIYRLVAQDEIPYIRKRGLGLKFPRDAIAEWAQEGLHKPRSYAGDIRRLQRAILNTPPNGDIRPLGGSGEMPKGKLKSASCDMNKPVPETELNDMANTKHSKLCNHKSEG